MWELCEIEQLEVSPFELGVEAAIEHPEDDCFEWIQKGGS
jgi:hypothetical protein